MFLISSEVTTVTIAGVCSCVRALSPDATFISIFNKSSSDNSENSLLSCALRIEMLINKNKKKDLQQISCFPHFADVLYRYCLNLIKNNCCLLIH